VPAGNAWFGPATRQRSHGSGQRILSKCDFHFSRYLLRFAQYSNTLLLNAIAFHFLEERFAAMSNRRMKDIINLREAARRCRMIAGTTDSVAIADDYLKLAEEIDSKLVSLEAACLADRMNRTGRAAEMFG
jgi:hypothetical protein